MYYTYILQSKKDGKWYTGATQDLRKRLMAHNNGEVPSTKGRGTFEIIYYESCLEEDDAFAREKFLKTGMGKHYLKNRLKRFLFLTGQVKKGARPVRGKTPVASVDILKHRTSNGGFVALITAIALSLILILVSVTLNQSGFFTRSALLESEYKERSVALAEACADNALLRLAVNPSYTGNETIVIDTDTCSIRPIKPRTPAAGHGTIETRALFQEATTNLRIVVSTSTFSIISWDERASF